ncbi:MAG TPA: DUF4386 domain-containing protein [Gemmatimonadales bacterium]|nr:DUF4386 domain-containing protein [Gemmatimonadales bacterium]
MSLIKNPGRVVGAWYLLLVFAGPLRLIYIPNKLFVAGNSAATASNIAAHPWLFRAGMVSLLFGAIVLIFLTMAFYRLFKDVDQRLAVLLVVTGGIMPALINFMNTATDGVVLTLANGTGFATALDAAQRANFVGLFLHFHHQQIVAAQVLWGVWLLPMGLLTYRSGFLPRFIGVWLLINGAAYVILCLTGILFPDYMDRVFLYSQPALFGELVIVLWLLIKGAQIPASTSA